MTLKLSDVAVGRVTYEPGWRWLEGVPAALELFAVEPGGRSG
jgi:hypothetical protein